MALKDRMLLQHPIAWSLLKPWQKYLYRYITRRVGADDVVFVNYGYEEDPPMALLLEASDEPNRYCIQLYQRTATQADLGGKRVLEIGCGHGGGASYLARTLRPASYTGLDLNAAGIDFCQKRHKISGLEFVPGDAENLPFLAESFDAVINIESSFHYYRLSRFLVETARVLRPGGHFLYADFRPRENVAAWKGSLTTASMRMLAEREINAEVARAMELNSEHWRQVIDRCIPSRLQAVARNSMAVSESSSFYRAMKTGRLSYWMYHFVKT